MGEPAAPADKPVYICIGERTLGRALIEDLRDHGLRARLFTSPDLLWNAVAAEAPAAIVAERDTGTPPAHDGADATAGVDRIALIARDTLNERLAAAAAGFDACFALPLNRPALIHRLHSRGRHAGGGGRLAVIAAAGSPLARLADELRDDFAIQRFDVAPNLLESVADGQPETIVVDGDAVDPAPTHLALAIRQYPRLVTIPLVIATSGDKRAFDAVGSECGLDALIGLPIDTRDLAGILRARTRRSSQLADAYGYLARRDVLTGVYNRAHFVEAVSQALAAHDTPANLAVIHARVEPGAECDSGDDHRAALVHVAEGLRRRLPALAVPARLDERELGVLVNGLADADLQQLVADLRESLAEIAWDSDGRRLTVATELGLAVADGSERNASELVAKARRPRRASPETTPASALGGHWRDAVAAAMADNRFRLVYQAISSLSGHPGSLFEVFVRMLHPGGGEVLPGEFLADAREAGLGPSLDRWVLSRAVHVLGAHATQSPPTLFVKLLPETVGDAELPGWLAGCLRAEGVPAARLVPQLPHATLLARPRDSRRLMQALADLGCPVAVEYFDDQVDDGATIARGGFRYLKLDHRLTRDLMSEPGRGDRLRAISREAHGQGIHTIACLVQDASALASLWQAGIDYIQGNFMQAPTEVFAAD